MKWMLDTNACINYLRLGSDSNVARHLSARNSEEIVLCSVVRAELLFGALRSRNIAENYSKVNQFVAHFASLPFDDDSAEIYGKIRADLTARGLCIGPNDLFIASIALARGTTLVTHNLDEFNRIAGLPTEDWEIE